MDTKRAHPKRVSFVKYGIGPDVFFSVHPLFLYVHKHWSGEDEIEIVSDVAFPQDRPHGIDAKSNIRIQSYIVVT